jgi:endonuclease-3
MNKANIIEIFKRFKAANSMPSTELIYHSHFELLVAVMLSAQATDISVNKATPALFKVANTPEDIFKLGELGLRTYIKTIGLYNTKAKHIIATCRLLIDKHQSAVPNTREALESLPGVGRKTANVLLNTLFGESTIAVDTHIFRVSGRIGFSKGATVLAVEKDLQKIIPTEFKQDAHHWLILHGRYVCVARKPRCETCTIADLCEYNKKTIEKSE